VIERRHHRLESGIAVKKSKQNAALIEESLFAFQRNPSARRSPLALLGEERAA